MSGKTPWPICAACRGIPSNIFSGPSSDTVAPHRLHPSFWAFQVSALGGCHSCTLLYEAVREPFKSQLETAPIYIEGATASGDIKAPNVVVSTDMTHVIRTENGAEFGLCERMANMDLHHFKHTPIADVKYVSAVEDVPATARNYKNLVSLYPDDPKAIQFIRQSLDNCLKNHRLTCDMVLFPLNIRTAHSIDIVCGKNGLTMAPTRLVDVGSHAGDPPRVVPGKYCLRDGRGYLALSYCNGIVPPNAPWRLTSNTLSAFEDVLPLEVLPQTLHDAIMWTRRLGERCIWIDSLCIIQDSAEDWERESSRMASIYGSATLTLGAASGSLYAGITDRRNPLKNSAVALALQSHGSSGVQSSETVYILPCGEKRETPLPVPAEDRAWCSQEDVLSPRFLKCTARSLDWQCLEGQKNMERRRNFENLTRHEPFAWYVLWYLLIERYSRKYLTYATDKLPAFSGIAGHKGGGTYLAGVLKEDIWASILWCRDESLCPRMPGKRSYAYLAPSWSWASIEAPVLFLYAQRRFQRKGELPPTRLGPHLYGVDVERSTFNHMGSVRSGWIDIGVCSTKGITTSTQINIFANGSAEQTQGRRCLVSGPERLAIGEIIFDVTSEAADHMLLECVLLYVANLEEWSKTGVAGLGIALQAKAPGTGKHRPNQKHYSRIGYVQFTPAFMKVSSRRRLRIV